MPFICLTCYHLYLYRQDIIIIEINAFMLTRYLPLSMLCARNYAFISYIFPYEEGNISILHSLYKETQVFIKQLACRRAVI